MGVSEPLSGSYLTYGLSCFYYRVRILPLSVRPSSLLGPRQLGNDIIWFVSFRPLRPMPPPPFSISSSSRPARVDLVLEVSGLRRSLT